MEEAETYIPHPTAQPLSGLSRRMAGLVAISRERASGGAPAAESSPVNKGCRLSSSSEGRRPQGGQQERTTLRKTRYVFNSAQTETDLDRVFKKPVESDAFQRDMTAQLSPYIQQQRLYPMYSKTKEQTRRDPYQEVTDLILEALEAGTKPWVRPWNPDQGAGPQAPFNPTTGKHYRGINVLILGMSPRAFLTADPRWMTYQQAKESGWQVRKGEKATTIFFYKPLEVDDADAEDGIRTIPLLKQYAVFHASQVDGIPAYVAPTFAEAPWQRPEAADLILRNSGAVLRTGGGQGFSTRRHDRPHSTAAGERFSWVA